jgi:hypothetical protein
VTAQPCLHVGREPVRCYLVVLANVGFEVSTDDDTQTGITDSGHRCGDRARQSLDVQTIGVDRVQRNAQARAGRLGLRVGHSVSFAAAVDVFPVARVRPEQDGATPLIVDRVARRGTRAATRERCAPGPGLLLLVHLRQWAAESHD